MPRYLTGTVTDILAERPGLQRIVAGGRRAYALTELIGKVAVGDEVVLNVTATDLSLGTGGWDVVHWNLSCRDLELPGGGHVMKLRYTSLQADTGVEEERGPEEVSLDGLPVCVGQLHSQLGPIAAAFARSSPGSALGYVMTDGAALPLALSDLVADLKVKGLIRAAVTTGQAFGGDLEAVNLLGGMEAARRAGCDAVVVCPGPGVVGTGTTYGFSGVEMASAMDLATAVGASVVAALRWSDADSRERHRGLSHHSSTALSLVRSPVRVAVARGLDPEIESRHRVVSADAGNPVELLADAGLEVTTMGRGPDADPGFFVMAAAAGTVLGEMVARS